MVKFFKYMFATFAGGIVAAFVLFIFFIAMLSGLAAMGEKETKIKENTILLLDLNGPIVDRVTDDPFADAFASLTGEPTPEGLNRLLSNIEKAKRDDNISGIVLESGMVQAGYATIEEIRNALIDFKTSGKFIYSFSPIYTQKAYYLASVADKIYLNPSGMLELKGMYAERMFFKKALEKVGVEIQVFKHGKFKSAVEPFLLEEMSEPARLQTEVYINSMWNHVKVGIAEARGLTPEKVSALADEMPMFRSDEMLIESGLIDGLKYKDEVLNELKEVVGIDETDDLEAIKNNKYAKVFVSEGKGFIRQKIAVIYAEGDIDGTSTDGIKSDKLSKTIRKARRDSSIKAIVFRVNSPGGSALGSEIIWREVKLAQETKPVIVSMGNYAASGGYYISCAADKIVANPTTLTGSIGIFGMIPNAEELTNKLGVSFDGVKTNKFADMPSITRPFRKDEKELLQAYIVKGYDTFIGRCADGRNTTKEAIDEIGQGRVWSGVNALDIDLVDEIGGINKAIELAKDAADLDEYRVVELPEVEDPIQQLMKDLTGEARMFVGKSLMGDEYKYIQTLENLKNGYQIQARIPYNLEIK
ncbi:signal peptide peptidase SppA [Carboxylicivirga mesophila]|uniref:Signal peptide peptidase SppA n=1 Tax=Carboxylicivirga mesophila TaxID=1166478 RepID=A0ABS5K4M5_9BACT|nr:signal peptide peptidase SppA [Carboxylicivirga mesophila]MBS2209969.1 signal peptide peptidase SppA [Carboxylicivirga mesophila]